MKAYCSFSEINLWERDHKQYIKSYIEGEEFVPNRAMILGSHVHKLIEDPHYEIVKLMKEDGFRGDTILKVQKIIHKVPKNGEPEVPVYADIDGVKLFGIWDRWNAETREMTDYKTTSNKERWNQFLVNQDKQLSFYAMMYNLSHHAFLKEINLCRILTGKNYSVKSFYTTRGPKDIAFIKDWTMNLIRELKQNNYKGKSIWEQRKGRKELEEMRKNKLI